MRLFWYDCEGKSHVTLNRKRGGTMLFLALKILAIAVLVVVVIVVGVGLFFMAVIHQGMSSDPCKPLPESEKWRMGFVGLVLTAVELGFSLCTFAATLACRKVWDKLCQPFRPKGRGGRFTSKFNWG